MPTAWEEIRRDFPGLEGQVYLNAAAASPVPRPVQEAVAEYQRQLAEGDNHFEQWVERQEDVRAKVARFIGAEVDEVAFVPNTSTGMNIVVDLLGDDGPVLSDELEFPAVTLPWMHRGIRVHFVPASEGVLRLEWFAREQAPPAATIAVSHVQFSNGCRQDLGALGAMKAGRHLVVNGSQSIGAFPVDVRRAKVDALACGGQKWLCAGYGAGFLFLTRTLLDERPARSIGWMSVESPFSYDNRRPRVRRSARRHELGSPSFAGVFALGAAIDYLSDIGQVVIAERVLALNMYLTYRLGRAGYEVLSPGGEHRSGQCLVAVPDPPLARRFLRLRGIVVTEKPEGLRIATHFFNDERDVDACVDALIEYRETVVAA